MSNPAPTVTLTYRYRVKSLNGQLNKQARAVNYVWNYCNETQRVAVKWGRKWLSGFDLGKLAAGSSKELGLHSGTIDAVCAQYAKSRIQRKKPYLRWRGKKSLGWIPLKGRSLKETPDGFCFRSQNCRVFKSRDLPHGAKIKDGTNFSRDARGRWYLNVVVEVAGVATRETGSAIGIDLGLTSFATLSDGAVIEHGREYRSVEPALAVAQRAMKKRRVVALHAKAANRRRDFLHKASAAVARRFDAIAVGNVNAKALKQTKFAKSVNDAAWSSFRSMLAYKAVRHGARYLEVNEAWTTQVCSCCGALPATRPKGIADLGVRRFECSECGNSLDRDVNAARNILAISGFGREAPYAGAVA